MTDFAYLIPALPLLGAVVLAFFGKRLGDPKAGWVGFSAVAGAFVATLITWLGALTHVGEMRHEVKHIWSWMHVGELEVDVSLLVDPLSLLMALFVSGVSALIHLYSIGYMKGDARFHQFFVYLNLFVFSMLVLVMADNFVLLFLGWEGVGACSYLLVGFWFERNSAATAAKKAFVVNRIGDAGLLLAMFLMFGSMGTLSYYGPNGVFENLDLIAGGTVTAIALLLLVGAVGKSAQLPLHVWLPDAMEGPTPVSALIHAATMVTAGVYLMARAAPVLELSPTGADVVAIVGLASAVFAATVACAQTDIKRVLAYSTMSQLGLMFAAVGVGAYEAGLFHMVTHAFFKALLFLSAGAVIHALSDEQNLKKMGNLRKYLPFTFASFMIGWLAISGIPPFAGFWSKDEVMLSLWRSNEVYWAFGLLTVFLTAFYMSRLFFLAFYGKDRWKQAGAADVNDAEDVKVEEPAAVHAHAHAHTPHEAPRIMLVPMLILAFLSIAGGLLNVTFPPFKHVIDHFLEPIFVPYAGHIGHVETSLKWTLAGTSVGLAVLGIATAWLIARKASPWPRRLEPKVLARAWFVDHLYEWVFAKPGRLIASFAAFVVDNKIVDGFVRGTAWAVGTTGTGLRYLQTGYVRNYALGIAFGTSLLLTWAVVRSVA